PGFESWATIWSVMWTAYILKLLVSLADTPFIYWARSIGQRHYRAETYDWTADRLAKAAVGAD
ncbi:MAG: VUT family protein, partial [bacterium]|nr:VUT family protein [bacterium]